MKNQYPLNFDSLRKGDEFGYERLCEIVGRQPSWRKQQLAFLSLRAVIEKRRPELNCRLVADGEERVKLVILLDGAAAVYNHQRFLWGVHKLRRGVAGQARIDRSQLTAAEQKVFDYRIHSDALAYRALRNQQRSTAGQLAAAARQKAIGQPLNEAPGAGVIARYEHRKQL
jgi:hypothetical protein